jgi:transcription elongation factor GreA
MDVLKKLQDELSTLEYELKHTLPKQIREAASHGDLSENAEYDAAKQRQQWVSARMGHLRARLQSLSLVDLKKFPTDRAAYGSTVSMEDAESGEMKVYRLVHPEEVDAYKGLISVQSPVGQALIGKQEGDEVTIRTASGAKVYVVVKLVTIHDAEE